MEAKIISLRVSTKVAQALAAAARARRTTKSRIILDQIEKLLSQGGERSSYDLGADLFGRYASGRRDTSTRAHDLYRARARAKHARR